MSRVSVIQFLEAPEGDEDAEEAAAQKRVWGGMGTLGVPLPCPCLTPALPLSFILVPTQGLQRRATPHPSELKVMKRGMEERRSEACPCTPGPGPSSPAEEDRKSVV